VRPAPSDAVAAHHVRQRDAGAHLALELQQLLADLKLRPSGGGHVSDIVSMAGGYAHAN